MKKRLKPVLNMDSKKAQSNIITIIIIILLIIILIIILWNIVMGFLRPNERRIQLEQKLVGVNININKEPEEWSNSTGWFINLTVTRGAGELTLVGEKTITYEINSPADIVSLVDMSGSMYYPEISSCVGISDASYCSLSENSGKYCCQSGVDCSNAATCARFDTGIITTDPVTQEAGACVFQRMFKPQCYDGGFDYKTEAGCDACGGYFTAYCYINQSSDNNYHLYQQFCATSSQICAGVCDGEFETGIDEVLGEPYGNKCYANSTTPDNCAASKANCESEKCNSGVWNSILNKCDMNWWYPDCCLGKNCNLPSNCSICNNPPVSTSYFVVPTNPCTYTPGRAGVFNYSKCTNPKDNFPQGANLDELVCETNYCKGEYRAIRRYDYAKNANILFIDKIFGISNVHRIAIINHTTDVKSTGILDSDPTNITTLKDYVTTWNITVASASNSDTNICKALNEAADLLDSQPPSTPERYKAIVLMTDGASNVYCNGTKAGSTAQLSLVAAQLIGVAEDIYTTKNIHIYTIAIGDKADKTTLAAIAAGAGGIAITDNDINKLSSLYDEIAYQITQDTLKFYKGEQEWTFIRAILYNATSTCTARVDDVVNPLETRTLLIPNVCAMTNINEIKIYLVAYTEDRQEVTKLLDIWKAP